MLSPKHLPRLGTAFVSETVHPVDKLGEVIFWDVSFGFQETIGSKTHLLPSAIAPHTEKHIFVRINARIGAAILRFLLAASRVDPGDSGSRAKRHRRDAVTRSYAHSRNNALAFIRENPSASRVSAFSPPGAHRLAKAGDLLAAVARASAAFLASSASLGSPRRIQSPSE